MFYTLHHEILEPEDGLTENSPGNDHTNRIRRPPIRLLVTLGVTLAVELAIIASAVTPALAQIEGSAGEESDSFELEVDETDPGFQPDQPRRPGCAGQFEPKSIAPQPPIHGLRRGAIHLRHRPRASLQHSYGLEAFAQVATSCFKSNSTISS
jgi:hypothetical protein